MTVPRLRAGVHYPRSVGELQSWFRTDEDCLDHLAWLRWPDGFVCPRCGSPGGWATADGRYKCGACGARTSVTAGTLFDRRRTPLTVWCTACWMFAAQKDGVSAQSLLRGPGDRLVPDRVGDAAPAARRAGQRQESPGRRGGRAHRTPVDTGVAA
ncbi:IS1595 family transposase [Kribbella speibonae]|uniref:IS1595 family transposase n=1 Tax=Kribbella speibonae TaxID=1572660 RepID=A0A4R0IV42_9ACTN|nr:IS1595 family transposase [Kribbella speibonae]